MQLNIIAPAPVYRASATTMPQTLGDSADGRLLADKLAGAACTFEVSGRRAVQCAAFVVNLPARR